MKQLRMYSYMKDQRWSLDLHGGLDLGSEGGQSQVADFETISQGASRPCPLDGEVSPTRGKT